MFACPFTPIDLGDPCFWTPPFATGNAQIYAGLTYAATRGVGNLHSQLDPLRHTYWLPVDLFTLTRSQAMVDIGCPSCRELS